MAQSRTFTLLRDVKIIGKPIPRDPAELLKMLMDPPWRDLTAGTVVTVKPLRTFLLGGRLTTSLEVRVGDEETLCSWGASEHFESYSGFPISELDPPAPEKVELPTVLRNLPSLQHLNNAGALKAPPAPPVASRPRNFNARVILLLAAIVAATAYLMGTCAAG